jgi:hypothetical protein
MTQVATAQPEPTWCGMSEEPSTATPAPEPKPLPKEIGGPKGPEPTRYGDWEVKGRCTDF